MTHTNQKPISHFSNFKTARDTRMEHDRIRAQFDANRSQPHHGAPYRQPQVVVVGMIVFFNH